MQFREHIADRQAAEAVRARIDWKYLLGLALTDPGFDFSVLSEFRDRLLTGSAEERLLDKLLEGCQRQGLIKARGRQRMDSTPSYGGCAHCHNPTYTTTTDKCPGSVFEADEFVQVTPLYTGLSEGPLELPPDPEECTP